MKAFRRFARGYDAEVRWVPDFSRGRSGQGATERRCGERRGGPRRYPDQSLAFTVSNQGGEPVDEENIGRSMDALAQGRRHQADAFRRLADIEPLPEKRKVLMGAAARCDELAAQLQRTANGHRDEARRRSERRANSPSAPM
jgi:hypothetical protein